MHISKCIGYILMAILPERNIPANVPLCSGDKTTDNELHVSKFRLIFLAIVT